MELEKEMEMELKMIVNLLDTDACMYLRYFTTITRKQFCHGCVIITRVTTTTTTTKTTTTLHACCMCEKEDIPRGYLFGCT